MSSQNENKKEEVTKARYHGLGLSNQGRGVIKSQSLAFQNSKWSNIASKSRDSGLDLTGIPGMTTVYVGRIPAKVSNAQIRRLLSECGTILRWSRQEDPTTKQLSSFGLCEFDSPEGVINAVNVLNGVRISSGQLLVKYQHGIDKEISKWQSNRINEMLKQRGGDCTIETILNELSVSDSKLRASIQRLLVGMSLELGSDPEVEAKESEARITRPSPSSRRERYESNKGARRDDSSASNHYSQHPLEIQRVKRFQERKRMFDKKIDELDDLLYELVKLFPDKMLNFGDLTFRYLIESLKESFYSLKESFSSSKSVLQSSRDSFNVISELIQSGKELASCSDSETDSDSNTEVQLNCQIQKSRDGKNRSADRRELHTVLKQGIPPPDGQPAPNQNGQAYGNRPDSFLKDQNENRTKITINLPVLPKKTSLSANPIELLEQSTGNRVSSTLAPLQEIPETLLCSSKEEIFSAENWKTILKTTNINAFKDYIQQEMKRIIGDSDQRALDTITSFVLDKFNSKTNIQDTINVLIQVLDFEAEPFLRGLFLKILGG
ncbi:PWI domain-containing protein [Cryptosporidium felis]|nr:PWI domain-containing protein [Cryptosporidium felis]